jgi:AraC-like DNA-binding protein
MITETLAHPTIHVVFERQGTQPVRAELFGVTTGRFAKELRGSGYAFGVKFRPAAHVALLMGDSRALTDRVTPLVELFGRDALRLRNAIARAAEADIEACVELAETFLKARTHELPEDAVRFRDLVERIAQDREILRVEDAAARMGLDVRTLQRRFRKLVGVSPKWVIQRYRMHEAAEALKQASPPPLAELAVRLGYYDQAHFSREFKAVVGSAPSVFAASARAGMTGSGRA